MIKFEFNGKPFNPRTFEESILKAVMEAAAEQVREQIGAIRHPETGEFPTVVVSGTSLHDLKFRVEGSPELLALVHERMEFTSDDDADEDMAQPEAAAPKVFMSYAWEDRELASHIAHALQANGIEMRLLALRRSAYSQFIDQALGQSGNARRLDAETEIASQIYSSAPSASDRANAPCYVERYRLWWKIPIATLVNSSTISTAS